MKSLKKKKNEESVVKSETQRVDEEDCELPVFLLALVFKVKLYLLLYICTLQPYLFDIDH